MHRHHSYYFVNNHITWIAISLSTEWNLKENKFTEKFELLHFIFYIDWRNLYELTSIGRLAFVDKSVMLNVYIKYFPMAWLSIPCLVRSNLLISN